MNFWKKLFGASEKSSCCCCGNAEKIFDAVDSAILKNIDPKIVVGKILKISAHPDPKISKVRVTQTEIAPGVVEQILCGGVNIAENMIVPVATIGTKFSENFEIGEREIRGEKSRGMICSRTELGLDQKDQPEHGIWPLPNSAEKFLGKSLCEIAEN